MAHLDDLLMRLKEFNQRYFDNKKITDIKKRLEEDIKLEDDLAETYLLIDREMEKEGRTYYYSTLPHFWIEKKYLIQLYHHHVNERQRYIDALNLHLLMGEKK